MINSYNRAGYSSLVRCSFWSSELSKNHTWWPSTQKRLVKILCVNKRWIIAMCDVQVHHDVSSVSVNCSSRFYCRHPVDRQQLAVSARTWLVTARHRRTTPLTDSHPLQAMMTYVSKPTLLLEFHCCLLPQPSRL